MYCDKKKQANKANVSSYETFGKAPSKSNRKDSRYLKVGFESNYITRRMQHSKFKYILKQNKNKANKGKSTCALIRYISANVLISNTSTIDTPKNFNMFKNNVSRKATIRT